MNLPTDAVPFAPAASGLLTGARRIEGANAEPTEREASRKPTLMYDRGR